MILTTQDQWTALFRSIQDDAARSEDKQVFLYASAADADAVCALRILVVRGWVCGCCRGAGAVGGAAAVGSAGAGGRGGVSGGWLRASERAKQEGRLAGMPVS